MLFPTTNRLVCLCLNVQDAIRPLSPRAKNGRTGCSMLSSMLVLPAKRSTWNTTEGANSATWSQKISVPQPIPNLSSGGIMEKFSVVGCEICWYKEHPIPKAHKKKIIQGLKAISEQIELAIKFMENAYDHDVESSVLLWLTLKTHESYYGVRLTLGADLGLEIGITNDITGFPLVASISSKNFDLEPLSLKEYEAELIK